MSKLFTFYDYIPQSLLKEEPTRYLPQQVTDTRMIMDLKQKTLKSMLEISTILDKSIDSNTIIIPVPSSTANKMNGITIIAQAINQRNNFSQYNDLLIRAHDLVPQKEERKDALTLKNSLFLNSETLDLLKAKHPHAKIIILDDVTTSGASLNSVEMILQEQQLQNPITKMALAETKQRNQEQISSKINRNFMCNEWIFTAASLGLSKQSFENLLNEHKGELIMTAFLKMTDLKTMEKIKTSYHHSLKLGIKFTSAFDPNSPINYFQHTKNYIYAYKGDLDALKNNNPTIVIGTRKNTPKIEEKVTAFLSKNLDKNSTVVSGLAEGSDTMAHIYALNNGHRTVAVLGSGIGNVYPSVNRPLAEDIIKQGGLIISPFLNPYEMPKPRNLVLRNFDMMNIGKSVIVIEGQKQSGTNYIVNEAIKKNVPIIAVPSVQVNNNELNIAIEMHNLKNMQKGNSLNL
jgi:predicted Rossmann fold nucleotide-binding protein DprA/Smf involved in DNA uptake